MVTVAEDESLHLVAVVTVAQDKPVPACCHGYSDVLLLTAVQGVVRLLEAR
jgi:hypothetical protein